MKTSNQEQSAPGRTPPYFAFTTLINLLKRMEEHGPPPRIDRSYLSNLSFSAQAQVVAGLKSWGLIEENGTVTPLLRELVSAGDDRPAVVRRILQERYPEAVELGRTNATPQQLEEVFRTYGVTGTTLRKAISFYLQAANYAAVPTSPNFRLPKATTAPRRRPKARRTAPRIEEQSGIGRSADPRQRYVDLLLKKAEEGTDLDAELLDRIERVIGVLEAEKPK